MAVSPGGALVVEGVVFEAAVKDADEPVGERSQGLVMEIAFGSVLVVVEAASGALGECAERRLVECVVEAPVADMSGEDGFLLPGRDG